jgi:peptidoglycan-associated lipoprotein
VLGIDSVEFSRLNKDMQKLSLLLLALALCGCHPIRPILQPVRDSVVPAKPTASATSSRPSEAEIQPAAAAPENKAEEPVEIHVPRRDSTAVIVQVNGELQDVFFEYDRAEVRPGGFAALTQDAALLIPILREFPALTVMVEGHCDERGSAEYNLGLGDYRGARAADVLHSLGIDAERIQRVSYGKERPHCLEPAESCWKKNRRAHLVLR